MTLREAVENDVEFLIVCAITNERVIYAKFGDLRVQDVVKVRRDNPQDPKSRHLCVTETRSGHETIVTMNDSCLEFIEFHALPL